MHPPRKAAAQLLLVASIAASGAGCAAGRASRAALIQRHTAGHVYHHARAEVIEGVRSLLEERGFEVMPVLRGEAVATEWRLLFGTDEFATAYERYFVVVHRLTPEHTRVEAVRLRYSTVGMETHHPTVPFSRDGVSETVNSAYYEKGWKPLMMGKPQWGRDLDVEWALIQRMEPTRSRQIEAVVDYQLLHGREPQRPAGSLANPPSAGR